MEKRRRKTEAEKKMNQVGGGIGGYI